MLSGLSLDDKGVVALSDKLRLLELRNTKITDASLIVLRQREKLRYADIRNCPKVSSRAIIGFKQNSKCKLLAGTYKGGSSEADWMEDEYRKSLKTLDKIYDQNKERLEIYHKRLDQ